MDYERCKYCCGLFEPINRHEAVCQNKENAIAESKCVMDEATVEIYNLKDEVTKLRIDINALKNKIRELGG